MNDEPGRRTLAGDFEELNRAGRELFDATLAPVVRFILARWWLLWPICLIAAVGVAASAWMTTFETARR